MAEREEQKKQRNLQSESRNKQGSSQSVASSRHEARSPSGLSRRDLFTSSPWATERTRRPFSNEIDRLFEDFLDFAGFNRNLPTIFDRQELASRDLGGGFRTGWSPEVEVFERNGQLIVRADLPGLNRDNVKVDIVDDALIIQGERQQEHEENEGGYYRSERNYGSFYRSIPLPEGIEDNDVKANFRDGVLEVTMPAPQRHQRGRRIEIGESNAGEEKVQSKAQTSGKS